MAQCSHCQQTIEDHSPLYLEEGAVTGKHRIGTFCEYSCLVSYIEDNGLSGSKPAEPSW